VSHFHSFAQYNYTKGCVQYSNAECHCAKDIMLSVIVLNDKLLSVILMNDIMLSVIVLNDKMLSVI
jgi:hypothetical protein